MTDRDPFGGRKSATGVDAQITRLNLFATPLMIATLPEAQAINTELKRIILAREAASESAQRSNLSGWQSPWDMHQWGGAPLQQLLGFVRAIIEQLTVDRAGNRHEIAWRVSCRANVNRQGHSNQFHTHPGALWSATYHVDDGGSSADPSLGGEFEIQDPRGVATVMYVPYLTFAGEDGATNLNETYSSTDFQASPEEYDAAVIYRVRNGDTLASIGRRHHITIARIKAVNALKSHQLHAGQPLLLYDVRPRRWSHHRHSHRISSN